MARIGIFSVLYIVPFLCVIGSNFYEFFNLPRWQQSVRNLKPSCLDQAGLRWGSEECQNVQLPAVEVYMLKLFMSLVVGITSGTWVWGNKKSFSSWSRCVQFVVFRRRSKAQTQTPPFPAFPLEGPPPPQPLGLPLPAQTTPLMMHSSSVYGKQSRSVTSKLSDRLQTSGRVSSCV